MYEQEKWALRDATARALGLGSAEAVELALMTPLDRATRPVPVRRRARLSARLAELAAQPAETVEPPAAGDEAPQAGTFAAACAACRGHCCRSGGDHAYLTARDLRRVGEGRSTAEIVALYLEFVPARAYRGSCIFHAAAGCALPRALRSRTCNRHLCGPLSRLQAGAATDGPEVALLVFPRPRRTQRVLIRRPDAGDAPG